MLLKELRGNEDSERATEEKLLQMLKTDKAGLARAFARRLEGEEAENVEKALENWWKEVAG